LVLFLLRAEPVAAKGSEAALMDERYGLNADLPPRSFIATATSAAGESFTVAVGVCACHEDQDPGQGKFWLLAGEQWVCPECDRTYIFYGERIDIAEPNHI
jgi:hypothetical protein